MRLPPLPDRARRLTLAVFLCTATALPAQQVPDTLFTPSVGAPTYAPGTGPRLVIDAGHHNFHTVDGRYLPFARLAARGQAFGISWWNGFAYDSTGNSLLRFARGSGLQAHPIMAGRNTTERVDSLVAFTGSVFRLTGAGTPLLVLPQGAYVLLPQVAWQFSASTPRESVGGMLQGAALRVERGRVVAAGEAAMFSAQRAGPQGAGMMGFNSPTAPQNAQFVLNVLHWLSGLLPAQ